MKTLALIFGLAILGLTTVPAQAGSQFFQGNTWHSDGSWGGSGGRTYPCCQYYFYPYPVYRYNYGYNYGYHPSYGGGYGHGYRY